MTAVAKKPIIIDGSYGEGGGQILRTSLALSAIVQRPLTIEHIRARRPKPGLAAQHLTAIRAVQEISAAEVVGAELHSTNLVFRPTAPPMPGDYRFDVAEAREGGSAGSAPLVLQTVAVPAAFSQGVSRFHILGGTHLPQSPCFDFVNDVWIPLLARIGIKATAQLAAPGFYPVGGGRIDAHVDGLGMQSGGALSPIEIVDPGQLKAVRGTALAANLPMHIPERMAERARASLSDVAPTIEIQPRLLSALCPGAVLFLAAEFDRITAGFTSLGRRGRTSEAVADAAVAELRSHMRTGAALDSHLADQALLPLAFARGPSVFTCPAATRHLCTNAWVIEQFGIASFEIESSEGAPTRVTVIPKQDSLRQIGLA